MENVQKFRKAFTLVEVLIVVAILGILAAVVLPTFQDSTQKAKETAAKDNLRILRNAIELYAAQHSGTPPGYPSNLTTATPTQNSFYFALIAGNYLISKVENPLNNIETLKLIGNSEAMPAAPTGAFGWIYKPRTKQLKLDYTGTDSQGQSYYEY